MLINGVATGQVVGQFIIGLADGTDTDDEPDLVGARGIFEFTPSTNYVPIPSGNPNAFTLLKSSFTAILDSSGYLCTPDPKSTDLPGSRGLRLFATNDPNASLIGWTWRVTPKFTDASGRAIASPIPAFDIEVPANGVVDLATVIKVPESKGVGTEQIIILAAAAQASAQASQVSAEMAAEEASAAGVAAYEASQASLQALTAVADVQKQLEAGESGGSQIVVVKTFAEAPALPPGTIVLSTSGT